MDKKGYSKFLPFIITSIEIAVLCLSYFISLYIKFDSFSLPASYDLFLYSNIIVWTIILIAQKLYEKDRDTNLLNFVIKSIQSILILIVIQFVGLVLVKGHEFSREFMIIYFSVLCGGIIGSRLIYIYLIRLYRKLGYNFREVVIVGLNENTEVLIEGLNENPKKGYIFKGYFDQEKSSELSYLGEIKDLENYFETEEVDIVFCSLEKLGSESIKEIIQIANNHLVKVKIISDLQFLNEKKFHLQYFNGIPVFNVSSIPLDFLVNRITKRLFDLLISFLVCLFIFSWLLPLLAFLIKLESKGPVFFRQKRTGIDGRSFECLKFRSMVVNNISDSHQATKRDVRITKLGAFLRKSSLDEFPQFLNVLKGNMSLIGPRPHMLEHTKAYSKLIDKFMLRHLIKPGITGLAQIKGYRGETKTVKQMEDRVRLDRFYVEHWSIWLDIRITFLTIYLLIKGQDNAY